MVGATAAGLATGGGWGPGVARPSRGPTVRASICGAGGAGRPSGLQEGCGAVAAMESLRPESGWRQNGGSRVEPLRRPELRYSGWEPFLAVNSNETDEEKKTELNRFHLGGGNSVVILHCSVVCRSSNRQKGRFDFCTAKRVCFADLASWFQRVRPCSG